MKARIAAAWMACMTILAWAAQAAEPAAPGASAAIETDSVNRILNGGFEFPPLPGEGAGVDYFWHDNPAYPVRARVVASPTAHGGKNVLQISPAQPPKEGALMQGWQSVKGASRVVLECYARGAGAQLRLYFYLYDQKSLNVGSKCSNVFRLGNNWTLCRFEYVPTVDIPWAVAALHVLSGEAEVDDVSLKVFGLEKQPDPDRFLRMAINGKWAEIPKVEEKPWRGNQLGISHTVPPPFKPIEVLMSAPTRSRINPGKGQDLSGQDFVVTCWGREYQFEKSPLPARIVSQGMQLLAAPVRFQMRGSAASSAEAPASCRWSSIALKECDDDKVVFESEGMVSTGGKGPLGLSLRTGIEFDGLVRYDLTVRPEQPVALNQFALEIPLLRASAPWFHYSKIVPAFRWGWFGASPDRPWNSIFSPTVWLGGCKSGLSWFAESPKGWLGPEDRQLEIAPEGDALILRTNFINQPMTQAAAAQWTFGLLATPTKPVPQAPSSQHVRSAHMVRDSDAAGVAGVEYLILKIDEDILEYHADAKMKEEAAEMTRKAHERKHLAVSWLQRTMCGVLPGYLEGVPDWLVRPFQTYPGPTGRPEWVSYCMQSQEWNDLLLYAVVRLSKEYGMDGVYFDTGQCFGCKNPAHGCGYLDQQGRWRESYPIFAEHEFKKRLYRALYEVTAPRLPYICSLANGNLDIAAYSFDTALSSGEELNADVMGEKGYRNVSSLPQWAAEFNPDQWGLWNVFLPRHPAAGDRERAITDSFLTFSLLYNTPLWIAYCDEKRVFAALDAIHKLGEHVRFVSPADVESVVTLNPSECKAALYKADGRMLLVLSNFGDAATPVGVAFSPGAVKGLKPGFGASDALTREKLALDGSRMTVAVPGNSFRMVLIGD